MEYYALDGDDTGDVTADAKIPALSQALVSFGGVKRRQELQGIARSVRVYDDFAHRSKSDGHTEHAAADGGTSHTTCGQAYPVDPRDNTMTGELVRLVTNDNGTPDDLQR